jgi:hypothetical protein
MSVFSHLLSLSRTACQWWNCQQPVNINVWHIPIAVCTEYYLLMMSSKTCSKHVEVNYWNKLKVNSGSCWFLAVNIFPTSCNIHEICIFPTYFISFRVGVAKIYDYFPTSTIQINQPTRCNNFSSFITWRYVQLNMFRASSRPSSGAQQLQ